MAEPTSDLTFLDCAGWCASCRRAALLIDASHCPCCGIQLRIEEYVPTQDHKPSAATEAE